MDNEVPMRKIGNPDFPKKPSNYYDFDALISVGDHVKITNDQNLDIERRKQTILLSK